MDPPSLPDRGAVSDQGGQAGARGREDVQVVLRNATEQLATATDDNDDSYVWVHEEEVQVSLSRELLQRGPRALEEEVQAEAPALEEEAGGLPSLKDRETHFRKLLDILSSFASPSTQVLLRFSHKSHAGARRRSTLGTTVSAWAAVASTKPLASFSRSSKV